MKAAIALMLTLLVGVPASAEPVRLLIAFGANEGMPSEPSLSFAERDAKAFASLMIRSGDVDQARATVLVGEDVRTLERALEEARVVAEAHASKGVTLFFYYSGHADKLDLHIRGERLPIERLEALLAAIPAELRVAVVDACRSLPKIKTKGFVRKKGFAIDLAAPTGLSGVVTMRSSSEGEDSQESEQLQGAVFTHYLLTALRGAADRDRDRRVTLDEAYSYAYRQTVRRSAEGPGNVMHPSVEIDVEGAGELVLTKTARNTAQVRLPQGADVRYLLFAQPAGAVVAEVWGDPDRALTLDVAPGRYLLQRRGGGRSGAYQFKVASRSTEEVRTDAFYALPEETLAAKGGELELWSHHLRAGGAGVLSHAGTPAARARVRYGYGMIDWLVSLSVEVGLTSYDTAAHQRDERWLGGDLRLELPRLIGPLDLAIGGTWRYVDQQLTRVDASEIGGAGYSTGERFAAFAGGPTLALGYQIGLGGRMYLMAEISGDALFRPEEGELVFRPEGAVELAIGASF